MSGFADTEALILVLDEDVEGLTALLATLLPGELRSLGNACDRLSAACDEALTTLREESK